MLNLHQLMLTLNLLKPVPMEKLEKKLVIKKVEMMKMEKVNKKMRKVKEMTRSKVIKKKTVRKVKTKVVKKVKTKVVSMEMLRLLAVMKLLGHQLHTLSLAVTNQPGHPPLLQSVVTLQHGDQAISLSLATMKVLGVQVEMLSL